MQGENFKVTLLIQEGDKKEKKIEIPYSRDTRRFLVFEEKDDIIATVYIPRE